MNDLNINKLKENIKKLASTEGRTEIEIITDLQSAAAITGNEELLIALCDIKCERLGI